MGLAILVWILTVGVISLCVGGVWWFPAPISQHAFNFDTHFSRMLWVAGAIFLMAQGLLGYAILRFRDQGRRATHSEGNTRLEVVWTMVTAVVFIGFALIGNKIWASVHMDKSGDAPIKIEVLAKQFSWNFRYPGPDGKLGRTDVKFIRDSAGNPFGIDAQDPAGRDDVISSAIRVPRGMLVELTLRSRDVIHNFFVRELRLKQDIVPGMAIPLRFRAGKEGTYEVPCSELCGLGHHQMRTTLIVMSAEDFQNWLKDEDRKPR